MLVEEPQVQEIQAAVLQQEPKLMVEAAEAAKVLQEGLEDLMEDQEDQGFRTLFQVQVLHMAVAEAEDLQILMVLTEELLDARQQELGRQEWRQEVLLQLILVEAAAVAAVVLVLEIHKVVREDRVLLF